MPKTALVILADGFEEVEAIAPIDILRRAGVMVTVSGVGKKQVSSSRNINVLCDIAVEDLKDSDWDCVVLPGGMPGATNLAASDSVRKQILNTSKKGGIVCAICASPSVALAPLGVLNGKKATCFPGMETDDPSIRFTGKRTEVDGNVITGQAAGCAIEFALKIVQQLEGPAMADKLARAIGCEKY